MKKLSFILVLLSYACNKGFAQHQNTRNHAASTMTSAANTDKRLARETSLPLDPAVRTGRLANGFTYFIRHNEIPKNRVTFYLANKVGSILEDEDQRGLAHFIEHMSFNGTTHFPKNALVDYLQKAGVRFGADINAYTSFDETVYQLPLPSDKADILQNGMQIMRDWAQEATMEPEEIDKERGVVLEEKRLGKGASQRLLELFYPIILNQSRYADRLPIGSEQVLNNFKTTAIQRFYKDWYRPNLQALIVVGDINVDEIENAIKAKFSDLKNPVRERPRAFYSASLTGKNQFASLTDQEKTSTSIDIIIKHPAKVLVTRDDYRDHIIRTLFNQMLGARYTELARQAEAPYIAGSANIGDFLAGMDAYSTSVTARPNELEKGLKAVWRETVRVSRFGFTQTELERVKKDYFKRVETAFKEVDKTSSASFLAEYLNYFLKGTAAPGIGQEYRLVQAMLPAINLADVNALCKEYIRATDRDIIILAPQKDKASLPDQHTVESWLTAVASEDLIPYEDKVSSQPLLTHPPIAGKVVKQESDEGLHITKLTMSNGLKVVLKPTDFKNDLVSFNAFAPGGSSLYSDTDYQSASYAAYLISAAGVGNYDATGLNKYLAGKQVNVRLGINENSETVSGSSTIKDLEMALELLYARFTQPRMDKAIFEGFIGRNKASLVNRSNNPNNVFSDTVSAFLGQGSIRRTGPSITKLEQINLDRAFTIYQERFADAANFTFVFTGSFAVEAILPLLEKYLASLPATHKNETFKDLGIHIPEGRFEKTVFKGAESKATVNLVFSGQFDYSASEKTQMSALKEVLQIRLLERLREDESGVYSPQVSESVSKYTQSRYSFGISFGCAPQNVEKLISSTLDEINKLKNDGALQVNIDKYKAENRVALETALKTDEWWLSYLTNTLQNQDDLHNLDDFEKNMSGVTPESLKIVANKYLNGRNYIRLVLLPESGTPQK